MKRITAFLLALALVLSLAGCGSSVPEASQGLTENGFYEGVTASDYVTLGKYKDITISKSDLTVTEGAIESEINSLLSNYSTTENITDGTVENGMTINIDYTGYINGEAFEGGSTDGAGSTVTIGVTSFIDDFLQQLIGHKPGETFDIEVTFPDPYENNPDLAGKDAVFTVTINYIVQTNIPEFTDEFVAENLDGYETTEEYRQYIEDYLYEGNLQNAIYFQLLESYTIETYPQDLVDKLTDELTDLYQQYADTYGLELEEYLGYLGISDLAEEAKQEVAIRLMLQAICEQENLTISDEFINNFFGEETAQPYISEYGRPYVCQYLLAYRVVDYLEDYVTLS